MKQNSTLLNEEISKIKKMMSIKGGDVISESSFENVDASVASFKRATTGMLGTNIDGIMAGLNKLPNKETFISFNIALKKNTGKTFEQHINDEFEDDNGPEALKIQQILKSKFNIDTDASVTGTQYMNPRQRMFKKAFKITNLNTTDPNKKDGLSAYMDTTKEPIKDLTQKQPEQTKQQVTTTSPQTFNDVVGGKGVLKKGMTSNAIGELQQKLISLGYSAIGKPTNYFGNATDAAVRDFQTKNSLNPDGKVGTNTAKKIDQILDIRKRRSASQGEVVPGVPDTKLPDTSISGLSNQKSTTTNTSSNTRGLTTAVQSYVPKGVSRTADFS
jgi:peptidoglycan hydrolase-like protein with peptidoglycan-binding domain